MKKNLLHTNSSDIIIDFIAKVYRYIHAHDIRTSLLYIFFIINKITKEEEKLCYVHMHFYKDMAEYYCIEVDRVRF